ncbi:NACHT, LRR and PYD domains-containing protein 1a-like isoform X1 [Sinocyclocheilus rhinocerous]|uniref:NACHT, LRR and PYD domains-containing protein 1a-like isoform X1 n=1 Tax=Sinocyclocheilus rhinocerous TaxID=307959 RepID=UPI0007B99FE1|nr:PREDICTED: NACHT, LRR and PYD domains-containing protein 1a-like isoform X1 [Sinocyclocheilus rhinocerous]
MAKPANIKSCEELEQLLSTYAEQIQELCRLYNTKSEKGPKKIIRTAVEQIQKLSEETEDQSLYVSSIPTTLESGIELIKRIIQQRDNDSDVVQPCRSQSTAREGDLSDTERLDVIQHDQQMMELIKYQTKHHRESPAVLLMFNNFRRVCHKMGINTASKRQCQTCADVRFQDYAEWDLIKPFVISEGAQMKYRLKLKPGHYECSRTGLRIECSRSVQLEYHICDWECVIDFLEMQHFTPCGPLMDIAIISGKLKAVYLPHFLCLGGSSINDEVRVVHVEDSGISFEKCTITRFHAKLLNHSFSPKGVLLRSGFSVNYHCETFIYETQKSFLTLHVYLIPSEKKMIEAVENNEIKSKTRLISKPGPVSSLQTKTWYSLRTLNENKESECKFEVQPKQLELKYKPIKPDFFEVFIDSPKDFHLQLMPQHHDEGVWDAKIRQDDYSQRVSSVGEAETVETDTAQKQESCKNGKGAEFVEKHRTELIQRVSLVKPIADDMKPLIGNEKYRIILKSETTHDQMRELLGFLKTAKLKEKLYQSLKIHEHFLVDDLERSG